MSKDKAVAAAEAQEAEAASERAAIVQAQAQRAASEATVPRPRQLITLPQGKRVVAEEFLDHKYAGLQDVEVEFIGDPSKFVLEPDSDYEYWLPDGADYRTIAKIEAEVYIPVKKEELDVKKMAPTHVGTDKYVKWNRHILVKVRKDYAERLHREPEMRAIRNLMAQQDVLRDAAERESGGRGYASVTENSTQSKQRI